MADAEVIVVGSGPAGVHAALALIERGVRVTMLDGGVEAPAILREPTPDFLTMRRTREDQWRWFLGEDCSAIPVDGLRGGLGGGMTSGNRAFVTRAAKEHVPLHVQLGAEISQSLALGGLGAVWGATCAYFPDVLLRAMGLPIEETKRAYREITERVGISGPPSEFGSQPAFPADHHTEAFLRRAECDSAWWQRNRMTLRMAHAAILTKPLGERLVTQGNDMDYYSDAGASVYRPASTLAQLRQSPLFTYVPNIVVDTVRERDGIVELCCHCLDDACSLHVRSANRVVLAAGAIGTGAIVARSLRKESAPLILKPHAFIAGVHARMLGVPGPQRRISSCQVILGDRGDDPAGWCSHVYGYRSMLLFRLLGSIPLPAPLALRLARDVSSALVVADVRFGSMGSNASLRFDHGRVDVVPAARGAMCPAAGLAAARKGLRRLGVVPARTMPLALGSSSHYAGTVPIGGMCDADGVLTAMPSVRIADASLFGVLPPQPHTLTLMATARRIGQALADHLGR